jgi:hypothetical protein
MSLTSLASFSMSLSKTEIYFDQELKKERLFGVPKTRENKLAEFYRKSGRVIRKKIAGCIFAEKLVLETRNPGERDDAVTNGGKGKVETSLTLYSV